MPPDSPNRGRRSRTRAAALVEITEIAGEHLARDGLDSLSLRSIAREMGMVSSGIYRHVSSRDELLTLLVVDGYRRLADAVEAAVEGRRPRPAFLAAADAVREVARADWHRHALLYGTPVADYTAPQAATEQADRLYRGLLRPLEAAQPDDAVEGTPGFDIAAVRRLNPQVSEAVAAAALDTWAALFGLISLELFGHLRGTVTEPDEFFTAAMNRQANRIGLVD